MGAPFLARAHSSISALLPGIPANQAHGLANGVMLGKLPPTIPPHLLAAARQGFFAGFDEILLIAGIVAAAGAVTALALVSPETSWPARTPPKTRSWPARHPTDKGRAIPSRGEVGEVAEHPLSGVISAGRFL